MQASELQRDHPWKLWRLLWNPQELDTVAGAAPWGAGIRWDHCLSSVEQEGLWLVQMSETAQMEACRLGVRHPPKNLFLLPIGFQASSSLPLASNSQTPLILPVASEETESLNPGRCFLAEGGVEAVTFQDVQLEEGLFQEVLCHQIPLSLPTEISFLPQLGTCP